MTINGLQLAIAACQRLRAHEYNEYPPGSESSLREDTKLVVEYLLGNKLALVYGERD